MRTATRRRVLATISAGIAVLAGCTGAEESNRSVPRTNAHETPVDYEFQRVRSKSASVLFQKDDTTERTRNDAELRVGSEYLRTNEEFDTIEFSSSEPGTTLRAFVEKTDFGQDSVFLYSRGVSACHDVHIQSVTVDTEDGDPHVGFCRSVRPATVTCDEDVTHTVGFAVRLPIDGREVTGHGSGMSHSCSTPPEPDIFETTVTVAEVNSK